MLLWILLHAHRSSATKSHMSCQIPIWRHWTRCCPWMLWVPLHSIIPILDSAGRSWNVHFDENKAYFVVLRSSQELRLYRKHLYVEYLYALIKMAGNKDSMRYKRKTKSIVQRKSCRDLKKKNSNLQTMNINMPFLTLILCQLESSSIRDSSLLYSLQLTVYFWRTVSFSHKCVICVKYS